MKRKDSFYNSMIVKFGFLLHKRFSIHSLVLLILNFIAGIIIIGLFNFFNEPLISYKILSFVFFIVLTTLLELIIKTYYIRYFLVTIIKSFGLITLFMQGIFFYIASLIVDDFSFNANIILSIFTFTLIFLLVRLALINIYQKYILKKLIREKN